MSKVNLGANAYIYPMPVTLVGANVEGRANFLAVGWVMAGQHEAAVAAGL